jgi:hypothetical protein
MKRRVGRVCGVMVLSVFIITGFACLASAGLPEGYRDVRLGMSKDQVLDILKKNPSHFSYDDRGAAIGEIVRGDNLFRYATYKFNKEDRLVEIALQMREVIGRDKVIQIYNSKHGLHLSPHQKTVESNRSLELLGNGLVLRLEPGTESRTAKGSVTANRPR